MFPVSPVVGADGVLLELRVDGFSVNASVALSIASRSPGGCVFTRFVAFRAVLDFSHSVLPLHEVTWQFPASGMMGVLGRAPLGVFVTARKATVVFLTWTSVGYDLLNRRVTFAECVFFQSPPDPGIA